MLDVHDYFKPLEGSRITRECCDSVVKNKTLTKQASLKPAFAGIHDPFKCKK
tara:strand:- start:945 stop:1100 length:156 start_codon:yes stop_codon:yes gene_type:complete